MEALERTNSEKNKNTSQTVVGKISKKMRADFPAADELGDVVRRQTNEWKTYHLQKNPKMTDFSQKLHRT